MNPSRMARAAAWPIPFFLFSQTSKGYVFALLCQSMYTVGMLPLQGSLPRAAPGFHLESIHVHRRKQSLAQSRHH